MSVANSKDMTAMPNGHGAGGQTLSTRSRLFFLALPFFGFLMAVGNGFVAPRNPLWVVSLLIGAGFATALAWVLINEQRFHVLDFLNRHATRIALSLIVFVGIAVIALNFVQAMFFALGPYPEDLAYYSQVLWNTLDGSFLSGNIQQERLFDPPVSNDLALHVSMGECT
jgi:hypothetical protein